MSRASPNILSQPSRKMTPYILLIHGNTKSAPTEEEWNQFFAAARESGMFQGGERNREAHRSRGRGLDGIDGSRGWLHAV